MKLTRPKFLKNDYGQFIFLMALKLFLTMVVFLLIGKYLIPMSILGKVWGILYISFGAIGCAVGSIKIRKKIFLYYSICFALSLFLSSFISSNELLSILITICLSFIAYWSRRFGPAFIMFPSFVVISFMIASIQVPIPIDHIPKMSLDLFIAGGLFYLISFHWKPWNTPKQLSLLVATFNKKLYINGRKNYFLLKYKKITLTKQDLRQDYNKFTIQAGEMYDKGDLWIVRKERKELWLKIWGNYLTFTRLFYLILQQINELEDKEFKNLSNNATKTLLLMLRTFIYNSSKITWQKHEIMLQKNILDLKIMLTKQKLKQITTMQLERRSDIYFALQNLHIIVNLIKGHIYELF